MQVRWPDFFVIGAMKAGTTTLHDYLSQHPGVFMCRPKEPGYFSQPEKYEKGDDWYLSLFATAEQERLWGDGSTCYSRWPTYDDVPERIYKRNAKARFIYVVRDPVSRAYSHYRHRMEEIAIRGGEQLSFAEAIERDEEMLFAGRYAEQLERFYGCFPRDQFYVYDFERLKADPKGVLAEIFSFLGLPDQPLKEDSARLVNKAGDVYAKHHIIHSLKSARQVPGLKQLFNLFPDSGRRAVFNASFKAAKAIGIGEKLGESYVETVPEAAPSDLQWLSDYYRTPNSAFSKLTGIAVDQWK